MDDYESLSDTKWDCKHRVAFIPKQDARVGAPEHAEEPVGVASVAID